MADIDGSCWADEFIVPNVGDIVQSDGRTFMFDADLELVDVTGQVPTTQAEMHVVLASMPSLTGHPPYRCGHPECTLLPDGPPADG